MSKLHIFSNEDCLVVVSPYILNKVSSGVVCACVSVFTLVLVDWQASKEREWGTWGVPQPRFFYLLAYLQGKSDLFFQPRY